MPYELPDPDALPDIAETNIEVAPLTAVEREVLGYDAEELEVIGEETKELETVIRPRYAQTAQDAAETVNSDADVMELRAAGPELEAFWRESDAEVRRIEADPHRSALGKEADIAKVRLDRDRNIRELASDTLGDVGDRVLRRYPAPGVIQPTAKDSAEAGVIIDVFSVARPADFVRRAVQTLRMALDAGMTSELRRRANTLLDLAYGPCLNRRALAPEPFASAWAGLYQRVASAVSQHLDAEFGAARHRRAVKVVAETRRDFQWLVRSAAENGQWDPVFRVGATAFRWDS